MFMEEYVSRLKSNEQLNVSILMLHRVFILSLFFSLSKKNIGREKGPPIKTWKLTYNHQIVVLCSLQIVYPFKYTTS